MKGDGYLGRDQDRPSSWRNQTLKLEVRIITAHSNIRIITSKWGKNNTDYFLFSPYGQKNGKNQEISNVGTIFNVDRYVPCKYEQNLGKICISEKKFKTTKCFSKLISSLN